MIWDVFCRVIDNHGDLGVCWRLACDLAARGQQVRLWIDDPGALAWMAPQLRWQRAGDAPQESGIGQPGVTACHWRDAEQSLQASPHIAAGDVVVEAFGCDPPEAFIERMQARAAAGRTPIWINLEYLSAEDYVERSHGLRSPVWSGAGKGLQKRFFYPGFTARTGGLLREPVLVAQRESETASIDAQRSLLAGLGVPLKDGDSVVLVFCYDHAPLGPLLNALNADCQNDGASGAVRVLLAPGAATRLGASWQASCDAEKGAAEPPAPAAGEGCGPWLTVHPLPYLPQPDFDRLLWCSDLNFVRGEDSAVRALWAGRPHVWHIYEQDDGVHAQKLEAFMNRWMADWPTALAEDVRTCWLGWNALAPLPHTLPAWRDPAAPWRQASLRSRERLLAQDDLVTQLLKFVTASG